MFQCLNKQSFWLIKCCRLPLVEAFVTEALRYGSLIIFNIKRAANRDTKIAGYHIPRVGG